MTFASVRAVERPRVWPLLPACLFALVVAGGGALVAYAFWPGSQGGLLDPGNLARTVIGSELALASFAVVAAGATRDPLAARLRLRRPRGAPRTTAFLVIATAAVGQVVLAAFTLMHVQANGAMVDVARAVHGAQGGDLALSVIALSVFPAVAEELFFRGFLQTRLRDRFGRRAAILVSSLAFAAFHLDVQQGVLTFALGLWLGSLAELTGSIAIVVLAHAIHNAAGIAASYAPRLGAAAPLMVQAVSTIVAGVGLVVLMRAWKHSPADDAPPSPAPSRSGGITSGRAMLAVYVGAATALTGLAAAVTAARSLAEGASSTKHGAMNAATITMPVDARDAQPSPPAARAEDDPRTANLVDAARSPAATFADLKALDDALASKGRFDEVVAHWGRYIEAHPKDARAFYERGGAYSHLRRADEALADCDTACNLGLAAACAAASRVRARAAK